MNTIKIVRRSQNGTEEITEQTELTRVRTNFTVSAAGKFQSDVTSEAETVDTGFANLNRAIDEMENVRLMLIATGKLGVKS